ncbi:MAG: NUDIX hydrolase [Anaerolineae bacterium]|nr:NUDIX hydrolase [Anaerolineae bacterium]
MQTPQWLDWVQRLQAVAQSGLTYDPQPFDRERYEIVREIAVEMLAAQAGMEPAVIRDLFEGQAGHATPKVDVRGVVFKDDALLLVRENLDGGRWTLPGGWADINEVPSEGVVREVYEESGYRTRASKLLAVYDRRLHGHPPATFHAYKMFFLCELLDDQPHTDYADETGASFTETGEVAFFPEDQIPADLSLGRVTPAQIKRLFEHLRDSELPTDFD